MENFFSVPELSELVGITSQGIAKHMKGLDILKEEELFKGRTRFLTSTATRKVLESRGYCYPKLNIAFSANKGGVGKTTIATNCAFRASQLGAKVLLVDLDMQANATNTFMQAIPSYVFTDIIIGKVDIEKTIIELGEGFHLLPSSLDNIRLEIELQIKKANPLSYIENILSPIRHKYDLIIIDLAPSVSNISYFSVLSSDTIYIPATPDIYSAQGIDITVGGIRDMLKNYPNKKFNVSIIWNKFSSKETNSLRFITDMKKYDEVDISPVIIRTDTTFKNAQAAGLTAFQYNRKSNACQDIDILTQNLLGLKKFFSNERRVIQ